MSQLETASWWRRATGARDGTYEALPIFESDVLLDDDFAAAFRRSHGAEPERMLMLAILEDAVTCCRRYAGARDARGRRTFADAAAWLHSEDRSWLFSFRTICDVLRIDGDAVRRSVDRALDSPADDPPSVADR